MLDLNTLVIHQKTFEIDVERSSIRGVISDDHAHRLSWSIDLFCKPEQFRGGLWEPHAYAHNVPLALPRQIVGGATLLSQVDDPSLEIGLHVSRRYPSVNNELIILALNGEYLELNWEATVDVNWDEIYNSRLLMAVHARIPWAGIQVVVDQNAEDKKAFAEGWLQRYLDLDLFKGPNILSSITGQQVALFKPRDLKLACPPEQVLCPRIPEL
ncbi:MAG: hypothetical protein IPJ88_03895 [Myxococcales bacterium]|nr:MAG: hypothetical protein IPJ88_03895 [Myxococcales bacterium]